MLRSVSFASEVPENDRVAVVRHMLQAGVLAEDGGILGLGERGEREFGRRHFATWLRHSAAR